MKNIYLITSTSFHLMEEEIKKIVEDNQYNSFDLNICDLQDIIEEASYISIFNEKKYIVVKNSNIFAPTNIRNKEAKEIIEKMEKEIPVTEEEMELVSKYLDKDKSLLNYLDSPNTNTILIFTYYGKPDSKKKIYKKIKEDYTYIDIKEPDIKTLRTIIDKKAKESGFKMDYDTISYIMQSCQNKYDLCINELEKIRLYYLKGCNVNLKDVKNIVCSNIEDNNFKFIDAVLNKDIKQSFKIYDDLMIQKIEPIMLLSMFAKEIRNMLIALKVRDKKKLTEIFNFKTEYQLNKVLDRCFKYKEKELENLLIYLCDLDYKIKRGKISNKLALQMFILKICK